MKKINTLIFTLLFLGTFQSAFAQVENSSANLENALTTEENIILFGGFALAVVAIFLYIARDTILRRKTMYDKEEFESKKDKTYEKYHSDWTDDYVDFTYTRPTQADEEFRKAAKNSALPDYYKILDVPRDASQYEIKKDIGNWPRNYIQIKARRKNQMRLWLKSTGHMRFYPT